MRLAIMQPYFMPYIGYFQLLDSVDEFVVYDNIEFTKKGWINRNRILVNGKDAYITIPLKNDSDYLTVRERYLSNTWVADRKKILNRITESYRKSPCFKLAYPLIEKVILFDDFNLFNFLLNSINLVKEYLEISTPIVTASDIEIDHKLKSQKKVIEICKARNAEIYINSIGGLDLYSREEFKERGIELKFIRSGEIIYNQLDYDFISSLSIIDVMMFNSPSQIKDILKLKTLQ
jgi:hypothetical protein